MEMEEEFNSKLREIGKACGKIANDINCFYKDMEKILFVVPLRGGWPIWKGVSYGLYKVLGSFEADVAFLPASSIVKKRDEFIEDSLTHLFRKLYLGRSYKNVIIVDEAISGSSSKMVFDSVKGGVKNYKPDKEWKRSYWRKINVELYLVVSNQGEKLDPRIQKLRNVLIYPIKDEIITTDNSKIYPIEYVTEIEKRVSEDGKVYRVVEPDVVFKKNSLWKRIVEEIEKGVEEFFELKPHKR
ncbi:MAG: hypothetical protein QW261_16555 [Candidatus Jordarchaeaceae archaeon]